MSPDLLWLWLLLLLLLGELSFLLGFGCFADVLFAFAAVGKSSKDAPNESIQQPVD